jgi:hypothetical protein
MTADVQAALNEVGIRRATKKWIERGKIAALHQAREPGVVHHDDVVGARAALEVEHLLLEEIGVRKLDELNLNPVQFSPLTGQGFEGVAFNAGVQSNGQ